MDPGTLAIGVHGVGELALICGGVFALYSGFRIIRAGAPDRTTATFKVLGLATTASGAGAVVMATAVVWAYLGVRMAPNFTQDATGIKVYTFRTDQGKVTAIALAAAAPDPQSNSVSEGQREADIANAFRKSLLASEVVSPTPGGVTLGGRRATVNADFATVEKNAAGQTIVTVPVEGDNSPAKLTYLAERRGPLTIFLPNSAWAPADEPSDRAQATAPPSSFPEHQE